MILLEHITILVLNEQGGELVAVLRGANAPLLQRMIVEELAKEKLVLVQGGERKTVSVTLRWSINTLTHSRAECLIGSTRATNPRATERFMSLLIVLFVFIL